MLIVLIHNISSVQRLIEIAKFIFNYTLASQIRLLVISKPTGSAAQTGIPEVSKIAYKQNRSVLIVNELKDAVEILKPEKTFIATSTIKSEVKVEEIVNSIKKQKALLILPGCEEAFSKYDLALGQPFNIEDMCEKIGIVPYVSITLYEILKRL